MKEITRLIVGSPSKHKLEAISQACLELGIDCKITGIEVNSGQNEQPVGMKEIFAGALTRAEAAQAEDYNAIAIGIESGLIRISEPECISIDIAVIVALFEDKKIIATSNGIQFPEEFVEIAEERGFEHTTVGSVISEFLGGDRNDPHSYVSDGATSRTETIKNGMLIILKQALKKWIN